jgi:hypothetical protein
MSGASLEKQAGFTGELGHAIDGIYTSILQHPFFEASPMARSPGKLSLLRTAALV